MNVLTTIIVTSLPFEPAAFLRLAQTLVCAPAWKRSAGLCARRRARHHKTRGRSADAQLAPQEPPPEAQHSPKTMNQGFLAHAKAAWNPIGALQSLVSDGERTARASPQRRRRLTLADPPPAWVYEGRRVHQARADVAGRIPPGHL